MVGRTARDTVLGGINVSVGAELADSVDAAQSLEASALPRGHIINFVGEGALVETDVVGAHSEARIAVALASGDVVDGTNGADDTVAVVEEEVDGTQVTDSLVNTIAWLALALLSGAVYDLVDATGGDATVGRHEKLAIGAASTVVSVVGESGQANALSGCVALTVDLAGLSGHTGPVKHIISGHTDAVPESIRITVGWAGLHDADASIGDVAGVADALAADELGVG